MLTLRDKEDTGLPSVFDAEEKLTSNPGIADGLMVIYFDLNKEIFCITHEN